MAFVEIDAAAMREIQIFLLKSPTPVMFFLPGDVAADLIPMGRTDAECTIAFLPCKGAVTGFVMNPFRGNRLDVANHIGEAGGGVQTKEEMNMIGHAADSLGNGA